MTIMAPRKVRFIHECPRLSGRVISRLIAMGCGEKRLLLGNEGFFDAIRLDDGPLFAVRPFSPGAKPTKLCLTPTATAFNGQRWWYVCPACEKRVTSLYWKHNVCGCRKCHGLRYASQYEAFDSPFDRMCHRLKKARVAIWGIDEPDVEFLMRSPASFKRPKGMRKKTFERKLERLYELEGKWNGVALQYFNAWKTEG